MGEWKECLFGFLCDKVQKEIWILPAKNLWSYVNHWKAGGDFFFLLRDSTTKEEEDISLERNGYRIGYWSAWDHDLYQWSLSISLDKEILTIPRDDSC